MKKFNSLFFVCLLGLIFLFVACQEDEEPAPAQPVAVILYELDEENNRIVYFTNNSLNDFDGVTWDFGDGNTSEEENPTHEYAEDGLYTVTLIARNGDLTSEATEEIFVGTYLTGDNVIQGSDMTSDEHWTITAGASDMAGYEFTSNGLLFSGEAENNQTLRTLIWQEITVEAGEYLFSAYVEGGGFHQAWLEVKIGPVAPEDGKDYGPGNEIGEGINSKNGKVAGINFWAGSGGVEPFQGNIIDVASDPEGLASVAAGEASTNGIITFSEAGTYYLVLNGGTWSGTMGDGALIRDIRLEQILDAQ